jgi:sigma-B regulation protein RsbU (phosphoserine phosphatase)
MPDPPTAPRPGFSLPFDELLKDMLECVPEGVVAADLEGRLVVFNTGARRMFGLEPGDVPSERLDYTTDCFLEDTVTPIPPEQLPLSLAIRGETVRDCLVYVRNAKVPDGIWINVSGTPLRDQAGALYGGVAVFRDVTDERRKLERLRLLSAVSEQTADAVIVTDRRGVIEYVNPAVEKMSGFAPAELIGKTPRVLRSGLHTSADYAAMWGTLLKGEVFRGTLVNRKKTDGELYYSEQTITPITDAAGRVSRFVSVAKDLTAVRAALERDSKLRLARSVQQRMYPDSPPPSCGFDVAGTAIPADETGGDYFDYLQIPRGGLALAVGDVSGHGFDAALHMVQARTMLRAIVQAQSEPGAVLARMNDQLIEELDAHRFMTLVLACLHVRSRTLHYASAGHTCGFLLGSNGGVKAELHSTGIPLGVMPGATFETVEVPGLEDGDLVALFTDGIVESIDEDACFGLERALENLRLHCHEPAAEIVEHICAAARAFAGGHQDDDMTMVVCKVGALRRDQGSPAF